MQDLFERVPEFDRFVDIVITPAGQVQLAIIAVAIYCGVWIARKVFQRFFSTQPERYDQLLPYALFSHGVAVVGGSTDWYRFFDRTLWH